MSDYKRVSLQGRRVTEIIRLVNHLPRLGHLAQDAEFRNYLNRHEPAWICPPLMARQVFDMLDRFSMELLTGRDVPDSGRGRRVILQLHGGGYHGCLHNSYRDLAVIYHRISKGADVVTIDYRVAPEDPFPAALEDAAATYRWLLEFGYRPENIMIAGDSAGGGLTLALCHFLKDRGEPLPAALITMSAWTDLTLSGASHKKYFETDPVFGQSEDIVSYRDGYAAGHDVSDPYLSPLMGDFTGFPPMLMQVGEYEMLLSDTLRVVRKARHEGVTVYQHIYPGMFHDFQLGQYTFPEAREAWREVEAWIRHIWHDGPPVMV